jgi:hypothetical protein
MYIVVHMICAFTNGMVGVISSLVVGIFVLQLPLSEILVCLVASNISGFLTVLTTLQAERTPWIRKNCLNRSLKTWTFFLSLYFGILLSLAPVLRNATSFLYLILPLILSTGFSIIAFGPVQDFLVRRQQQKNCPN